MSKADKLIDILDGITWYNGIFDPLFEVKNMLTGTKEFENNNMLRPKGEQFEDEQFEIFWMMLVLLFGDYGTSPRSGWLEIENKDEIIEFIDSITRTARNEKELGWGE